MWEYTLLYYQGGLWRQSIGKGSEPRLQVPRQRLTGTSGTGPFNKWKYYIVQNLAIPPKLRSEEPPLRGPLKLKFPLLRFSASYKALICRYIKILTECIWSQHAECMFVCVSVCVCVRVCVRERERLHTHNTYHKKLELLLIFSTKLG